MQGVYASSSPSWRHDALVAAGLVLAYVAAGKLGLALAFLNASASPVWPPTGIALAALLLFGSRFWPAVFAGAFVVNATTAGSPLTAFVIAAGNAGEAVLGTYLTNRYARQCRSFSIQRDFVRFVAFGMLIGALNATVGVTSLAIGGFVESSAFGRVWMTWWLGDATGAIVVTPPIVLWWRNRRLGYSRAQWIELALLFCALVVSAWIAFFRVTYPIGFLCVLVCGWAAVRFGHREAATATCVLTLVAVWGTVRGDGSFGVYPPNDALLLLQLFMAVTTIAGIVLGVTVHERREAESEVRLLNADLEQRVRVRTRGLQKALDDLTIAESRLEEAQEVAHTGSWEWTIADNSVWWSKELHRIYGLDAATYDGFFAAVHPEDRQRVHDIAWKAVERRLQAFEYEHRVVRPDGDVRTLYGRGRAVVEGDRVVRLVGTEQDVTERKEVEAQLLVAQKREAVGRLVSGVAHDFNNLLTAIGGYTDLVLQDLAASHARRSDLLEIKKASERATALTRQLLSFSRQHAIEPHVVDLNGVIETLVAVLRRLIGEAISIETSLEPNLGGIYADARHIEQILINLAVNARDAMPDGGQLLLETRRVTLDESGGFSGPERPPPGAYVLITVSDTGTGMDDLVKSHAFEPFFTTKPPGHGTGLGLATVYNIVKRFSGYVSVHSEPGRGTAFKIYFPATHGRASAAADRAADAPIDVPGGAETILLVEDDDGVRRMARATLQARGYRVIEARTGEDALTLLSAAPVHINAVVTDVVMPGLDGPALVAELRRRESAAKVLYMSGYTERAGRLQGLLTPETPLLEKPFTPTQLLSKVRMILDAELPSSA